ncbi:hypothetical protein G6F31_021680 [Rhizopus arrhizus]|nr:hypothetical protein G6F31_021680 [Rhizopus arrhizus]
MAWHRPANIRSCSEVTLMCPSSVSKVPAGTLRACTERPALRASSMIAPLCTAAAASSRETSTREPWPRTARRYNAAPVACAA